MKTNPMSHQSVGAGLLADNPEVYALACEQGTGKTWIILADAERQFAQGLIGGLLVIAPKGVHSNWVLREIPTHLSVDVHSHYYLSGMGKRRARQLERLMEHSGDEMPILTINIDALNTAKGREVAARFVKRFNAMVAVDESQRIKNPTAKRSKYAYNIGRLAASRRIATGTMIANSPLDAYGQFHFLEPGLLGTTSYRAFVAEFAELLPPYHPVVQTARERSRRSVDPQIVATDEEGRPRYRNLDRLAELMSPYTYRVTKEQCLDLPDKIYKTLYFELSPRQRRVYDEIAENARYEHDNGRIDAFDALTLIGKLRQATSGFIMVDGEPTELDPAPDRLRALMEAVADVEGQFIVWAVHRAEIALIAAAFRKAGVSAVEYHGGVSDSERVEAIDRFQSGDARAFIGNAQAGGTGLTLTAAETAIYYSCDFSLDSRLQSEDRCHRIGTKNNVVYIDLAAVGTVDERVAASLQMKHDNAMAIMNAL